jgi:hypothetical protein
MPVYVPGSDIRMNSHNMRDGGPIHLLMENSLQRHPLSRDVVLAGIDIDYDTPEDESEVESEVEPEDESEDEPEDESEDEPEDNDTTHPA